MFLSVSRQNDYLRLTGFTQNQDIRPVKVQKLQQDLLAIVSSGQNIVAFSEKGQVALYDSSLAETDNLQLHAYRHAKYDVFSDFVSVYSDALVDGAQSGITAFKIENTKLVNVDFCQCVQPTHIACYSTMVAAYFKTGKNKYQLLVFEYATQRRQVFNLRERCKTLRFDWNGELILITKGPQGKYTFQRFYSSYSHELDAMPDLYQVDGEVVGRDGYMSENEDLEEVQSPEQQGRDDILQTSAAKTLSYQFRTCVPSENVVIAGRFDSYVAMENKNNPISCVLHSYYKVNPHIERVCVDWTKEGYFICYVSQDYYYINVVRYYNLDYTISLKAKDIYAFAILNLQQKIEDVVLLDDSTMVCLCKGCLVSFGQIGRVVMQKEIEMQRFCFDKERKSVLFINGTNIMLYMVEQDQIRCYREVPTSTHMPPVPEDEVYVIETEELYPEYVELDRQAKVVKYFKKDSGVEIWWQTGPQSETARSVVAIELME